jgi:hypothetical protein
MALLMYLILAMIAATLENGQIGKCKAVAM